MKSKSTKRSNGWYKYSIFSADFETTHHKEFTQDEILMENRDSFAVHEQEVNFTPNESSQVFLAGLMSLKDYSYCLSYEDIAIFLNNIAHQTYAKEHHNKALVYFHNLAYDGSYLLNWLLKKGWKQSMRMTKNFQPALRRKEFSMLLCGGKFFNLTLWWRGIKIIFVDSLKYFPVPLANLGEKIGFPKLKETVDYTKFKLDKQHNYPKEWLTYLKRDCEILARFLNDFFEKQPNARCLKRQTIGSVSYHYIKKTVAELTPNFTVSDYHYYEQWYHGGLTFPSLKHWGKWVKGKIRMIDAVSLYPTQMTKYLPYGEPLDSPPDTSFVAFHVVHIKSALIKEKYSAINVIWKPFVYQNGKKLIIPNEEIPNEYQYLPSVENKIYYLTDIELEVWNKLYDIDYKIIKSHYFRASPYLKSAIQMLYKAKEQAKKEKDATGYLLSKLVLNNLYGKLGQKPERPQDFYGDIESLDETEYKILGDKHTLNKAVNIMKIKKDTDKAQPIFVASYITSLGRVALLNKYLEITNKGAIWLYADTDSLCYKDTAKGIEIDDIGTKLGQWSFEDFGTADGFCSLCPKQYRIVRKGAKTPVKLASAGVKKEIMKKIKNQEYNYNDNPLLTKTQLKNSVNGKVIWNSPFNFQKWKRLKKNPKCPKELYN